eukprot:4019530-Pyramimonas_sp.AAC.1
MMHEASRRVRFRAEIKGPGSPEEKCSWMLALNRAHRAGRQDIASRACRSYPRLLDFYDPTVMQWHDLR